MAIPFESKELDGKPNKKNLLDLQQQLLLRVLLCATPKTVCRLRRSCKTLSQFVEKHRFRICTPREDSRYTLQIRVNDGFWQPRIMEYDQHEFGRPNVYSQFVKFLKVLSADIYEELSAIPIGVVCVERYGYVEEDDDTAVLNATTMVPLLKNLRLNANSLLVKMTCTKELLTCIRYSHLSNFGTGNLKLMQNVGIKECYSLCLYLRIADVSVEDLSPFFQRMKHVAIKVWFDNYRSWWREQDAQAARDFLKKVLTINRRERGSLQRLRLLFNHCNYENAILQDISPFHSCRIESHNYIGLYVRPIHVVDVCRCRTCNSRQHYNLHFYKVAIEGGFAVAVENYNGCVEIHYLAEDSRSALFDIVWPFLCKSPPEEKVKILFIEANSDSEAIGCLQNSS